MNTETNWGLLIGNLVAATVSECESHEQDDSEAEQDAAADRFTRAESALVRAVEGLSADAKRMRELLLELADACAAVNDLTPQAYRDKMLTLGARARVALEA